MKPQQRLAQLTTGVLIAVAALTACRKEVPPPPLPKPEEVPKPKVEMAQFAAVASEALRLVFKEQRNG